MADLTSYAGLGSLFKVAADAENQQFDPFAGAIKVATALQAVDNLKARREAQARMEAMRAGESEGPTNPYLQMIGLAQTYARAGDAENAKRYADAADNMIKDIGSRDPRAAAALLSQAHGRDIQANSPDLYELKQDATGVIRRVPKIAGAGGPQSTGMIGEMELEKAAMAARALAQQGVDVRRDYPQLAAAADMWFEKGQQNVAVPQDGKVVQMNPRGGIGGRGALPGMPGGLPGAGSGGGTPGPAVPDRGGVVRVDGVLQREPTEMRSKDIDETQKEMKTLSDGLTPALSSLRSFDPKFLTYMGQGKKAFLDGLAKAGVQLSPDSLGYVEKSSKFMSSTAKSFNTAANEFGGKNLTKNELERMQLQMPNPSDSPAEYLSKLDSNIAGTYAMLFRRQLADEFRVSPNVLVQAGVDAPSIQQGIAATASRLAARLTQERGMTKQEALAAAYEQVGRSFYPQLREAAAKKLGRR